MKSINTEIARVLYSAGLQEKIPESTSIYGEKPGEKAWVQPTQASFMFEK